MSHYDVISTMLSVTLCYEIHYNFITLLYTVISLLHIIISITLHDNIISIIL